MKRIAAGGIPGSVKEPSPRVSHAWLVVFGVGLIALFVVVGTFGDDASAQPNNAAAQPARAHFKHDDHKNYVGDDGMKNCKKCHSIDAKGAVAAPAAQGHAPCLDAKCHAETFLTISEKNAKNPKKAEEFKKASSFCLACHEQVPWAWKKPTVRTLQAWENQREHHIEMNGAKMNHHGHATFKKPDGNVVACRDCHVVGENQALVKGAPGHTQCSTCHVKGGGAFEMSDCGRCHKEGSREDYLRKLVEASGKTLKDEDVPSRPGSDIRTCGSDGEDKYKKKGAKPKWKCFKHETKEHREKKGGGEVQCKQCHWIVVDDSKWGKREFKTTGDLHLNKIIGDSRTGKSEQHKACAGCHPHTAQVELATANCEYCHAERTTDKEIW